MKKYIVVLTSIALSISLNIANVSAKPTPSTAGSNDISKTVLNGIFSKHPHDGKLGISYPRVSVRIHKWDAECYIASAVLWQSESKYEEINNFRVCTNITMNEHLHGAKLLHAFLAQSNPINSSGNVRTDGPVAPMMSVPFNNPVISSGNSQNQYAGFFIKMLSVMGWQPSLDMNVWVVDYGPKPDNIVVQKPANETSDIPTTTASLSTGSCSESNVNESALNSIKNGMKYEQVLKIVGCSPDSDLTNRSQFGTTRVWVVAKGNLFAALSLTVIFDKNGNVANVSGQGF